MHTYVIRVIENDMDGEESNPVILRSPELLDLRELRKEWLSEIGENGEVSVDNFVLFLINDHQCTILRDTETLLMIENDSTR